MPTSKPWFRGVRPCRSRSPCDPAAPSWLPGSRCARPALTGSLPADPPHWDPPRPSAVCRSSAALPSREARYRGVAPSRLAVFTFAPAAIRMSASIEIVVVSRPLERRGAIGLRGVHVSLLLRSACARPPGRASSPHRPPGCSRQPMPPATARQRQRLPRPLRLRIERASFRVSPVTRDRTDGRCCRQSCLCECRTCPECSAAGCRWYLSWSDTPDDAPLELGRTRRPTRMWGTS